MENEDDFKAEVYNYIKELGGGVSFAEITETFGTGDSDFILKENIYAWIGMPENVITAINELINEKELVLARADPLCYLMDGMAPNMPIAKEMGN